MISISGKTSIQGRTTVGSYYQPSFTDTPTNTFAGVYSLRKVVKDYNGYACRVLRSQDSYQLDIGFDANGNLDETALSTFVGGGNLFTASEQFDSGVWTKLNITVTANQTTAPDGTTTADLLIETITSGGHSVAWGSNINYVSGQSYTVSCYFKKGSGATAPNIVQLTHNTTAFGSSQYANFNINTGIVTASSGGTATITAAANGFYRCSFTATATNTISQSTAYSAVFVNNNPTATRLPSYAGQTTSDIFAWGAQFNIGALQPYVQTGTNQAGLGTISRWYEQDSKHFENLNNYSEEFDNAYWGKTGCAITADQIIGPTGNLNADKLACLASSSVHNINPNSGTSFTAGLYYTLSVSLRKGSGATAPDIIQVAHLASAFAANVYANFNINTGVVTLQSNCIATITKEANGFYRCAITALCITTNVAPSYPCVFVNNNPSATLRPVYLATTTEDVFMWGAQINTGTEQTPYIRAVASAVTYSRAVFQATVGNQPTLVNYGAILKDGGRPILAFNGSGTLMQTTLIPNWLLTTKYAIFSVTKVSTIKTGNYFIGTNGAVAGSGMHFGYLSTTQLRLDHFGSNADYSSTQQISTRELLTAFYNNTGSQVFKNGTSLGTSANPTSGLFTIGTMNIGASYVTTGPYAGFIQEILIFNSDMSSYRTNIESNINSYYSIY